MNHRKFWPLSYDPEGEIYENPAWDLPGFKRRTVPGKSSLPATARKRQSA